MIYILLGVLLGAFIYYKVIKPTKYWENRNVVYEPAWPIVGNMGPVILRKKHALDILVDLYKKYSDHRYVGMMQFSRPMLLMRDIELIKQITVKDFEHFHDRPPMASSEDDLLLRSLIILNGQDWHQMRATLSPVFTSGKLRIMYQLIAECAENFVDHFKGREQVSVEMKDIFTKFAIDVIATTAFGIQIDSVKEPDNTFLVMGSQLNKGTLQFVKIMMLAKFPHLAKMLGTRLLPAEVTNFFRSVITDNINKREEDGIVRPDLIHLLMEARKGRLKHDFDESKDEGFAAVEESDIWQTSRHVELTDDEIVAQAMLFFFAGFDTVSTVSCFLAHELAVHPEVQEKLQYEIDVVNQEHRGRIPYELLLSMKYLDQVISEILRLWNPGFQTDRVCTKDLEILPKNENERKILLRRGELVLIPIGAIHRDPEYFPEPDKFDPERFSEENKDNIIPGTYIPFGGGPRNCIGSRFALLEIKILFFYLLSKFDIVVTNRTQIPLQIGKGRMYLDSDKGFWLGFKPRKVTFY